LTVGDALADAARRLAATSATPRLDAELLMAHALGVSRENMLLGGRDGEVPAAFAAFVERRRAHEPVAYITGYREFWTIDLAVGPGVLIPRPDSETLIEAAIGHCGADGPRQILDLGTGSGALLLAALAEWPEAVGVGVDMSDAALRMARANADRLGMANRAMIARGSWDAASGGNYDLILCNPPYVADDEPLPPDVADYEPAEALYAGPDGLDEYRRIAPLLRLPPGGIACFEIGASQAMAVCALFEAEGFLTGVMSDLAGHDRCVVVTPMSPL
jgi:release factor glutamine methyltransferase